MAPHMRAATAPAAKAWRMNGYWSSCWRSCCTSNVSRGAAATNPGQPSMGGMEGRRLRMADHDQAAARRADHLDRRAVEPAQCVGGDDRLRPTGQGLASDD